VPGGWLALEGLVRTYITRIPYVMYSPLPLLKINIQSIYGGTICEQAIFCPGHRLVEGIGGKLSLFSA